MAKYFYKKDKRVKRLGEDDQVQIDEYKSRGYVQVDDRRAPKPIEKPKPKPPKPHARNPPKSIGNL